MGADDILLTYWGWLLASVALAIAEVLAPGFFMMWLAAAALATGILTFAFDLEPNSQLVNFAALALIAVAAGRQYLRKNPIVSDDRTLNRRADRLIGEIVTVVEPIIDGHGKVRIGDSPWLATGPDMPAGTQARVVRCEGSRLTVEPVRQNAPGSKRPEDL